MIRVSRIIDVLSTDFRWFFDTVMTDYICPFQNFIIFLIETLIIYYSLR